MSETNQTKQKIPFYRNVIAILLILETAIVVMYGIDTWLVTTGIQVKTSDGSTIAYVSHAEHLINLQMIVVGGAVAVFDRLIPKRKDENDD